MPSMRPYLSLWSANGQYGILRQTLVFKSYVKMSLSLPRTINNTRFVDPMHMNLLPPLRNSSHKSSGMRSTCSIVKATITYSTWFICCFVAQRKQHTWNCGGCDAFFFIVPCYAMWFSPRRDDAHHTKFLTLTTHSNTFISFRKCHVNQDIV